MNLRGKFAFAVQSPDGCINVDSIRSTAKEVRQYMAERRERHGDDWDDLDPKHREWASKHRVQKVLIVPFDDA